MDSDKLNFDEIEVTEMPKVLIFRPNHSGGTQDEIVDAVELLNNGLGYYIPLMNNDNFTTKYNTYYIKTREDENNIAKYKLHMKIQIYHYQLI